MKGKPLRPTHDGHHSIQQPFGQLCNASLAPATGLYCCNQIERDVPIANSAPAVSVLQRQGGITRKQRDWGVVRYTLAAPHQAD